MELPKDLLEKHGKIGEGVYKKGHKDGKLEGAKVAKSAFANEINTMVNQVIKGKEKENYKAPKPEDVGTTAGSIFKMGNSVPDRSTLKRLLLITAKALEAMPLPPKKPKTETPPTSN
jgi:hypothetical protein